MQLVGSKRYFILFLLCDLNLSLNECKSIWLSLGRYELRISSTTYPRGKSAHFLTSSVWNFWETMSHCHFSVVGSTFSGGMLAGISQGQIFIHSFVTKWYYHLLFICSIEILYRFVKILSWWIFNYSEHLFKKKKKWPIKILRIV